MIRLQDLHIGYQTKEGERTVFAGLQAEFGKSELIGLVGNNGVGKSTLIKTMFGALKPLKGDVVLNGRALEDYSLQELAKTISIVLTERTGGFNLKAADVVAAGRIPYLNAFGQLREEDERIVARSMEEAGISGLRDKPVDELSDGQRQKVMIAKSLAQQTPVILLDEPTAFLDYRSKRQMFTILKQLCKEQGKCIIVSSHDLEILFRNVDKVLHLKENNSFVLDVPSNITPDV